VGSGARSMTLLRAGADVVGYEIREDFANRARTNVVGFLGSEVLRRYRVEIRDVYDGIDEQGLDRIILDLPEPWRVIKHAETALHPGGILVSYLPTIGQVAQLREAMEDSGLGMAETIEVWHRSWHIDGPSVRPDHRMVAHTGFLTSARLLAGKRSGDPLAPYAQARRDQRRRAWPDGSLPLEVESSEAGRGDAGEVEATELEPSGLGPSALGPSGLGPSGLGPSGLGPSALGPSGLGPSGLGPSGLGPSGQEAEQLDAEELEAEGLEAEGLEAPEGR